MYKQAILIDSKREIKKGLFYVFFMGDDKETKKSYESALT